MERDSLANLRRRFDAFPSFHLPKRQELREILHPRRKLVERASPPQEDGHLAHIAPSDVDIADHRAGRNDSLVPCPDQGYKHDSKQTHGSQQCGDANRQVF